MALKVEIWSDVVCPFCYIGKRKFENALNTFSHKEEVEIIWRSYQLDPDAHPWEGQSVHQYLSEKKGISLDQAKQMNNYVTNAALQVGLNFNMNQAIVANTLNAHRLLHLAAKHQLQNQMEESLFKAYFEKGKNIGDKETLVAIGIACGLEEKEIRKVLEDKLFEEEIRNDQYEAYQVGARGVPFFVFNNKYAVSGAQATEVFSEVLSKIWSEENPVTEKIDAGICTTDGNCP